MANLIASLRSGAIWGAFTVGATGLLTVVNGGLLARALGASELGYFFIILPLVRLLSMIVGFGMQNGILKEIGIAADRKNWKAVRRVVRLSGRLLITASLAGAAIFMAAWPLLADRIFDHRISLLLGGVIFIIVVLRTIELLASSFFRAVGQTTLGLMMLGVPRELLFAGSLLVIWLSVGKIPIGSVLWLYLAVSLVIAVVNCVLIGRFYATHSAHSAGDEGPTAGGFIELCVPVMLQTSTVYLLSNADIWCLGFFRSPEEVGVYGAVVRLNIVIDFVLSVVNLVLPPMVAALYSKHQIRKLTVLMRTSASWSFIGATSIVLLYLTIGDWLLRTIFGPKFEDAWIILVILAIGRAVNSGCGSPGIVLQMTGFHGLLLHITLVSAALNLIANILVAGPYGPIGVAIVTATSLILQKAAMAYFAYRKTGVGTLPSPRMLAPQHLMRLVARIPRSRAA